MEENSQNSEKPVETEGDKLEDDSEQVLNFDNNGHEDVSNFETTLDDGDNGLSEGKDYPPPITGMEFESYDDAYNYYNCYAKELGFAIRVKSSWTKRNSKEKRGAVLCCNCEGFKTLKEANSRRKETRTGCRAMIRLRLVESRRWRVDEAKLDHNHSFDPERAQNSKSQKKMGTGAKRKAEPAVDVKIRTIKLYRTPAIDSAACASSNSSESEASYHVDQLKHLKFKRGDSQVIYNYFCQVQLTDPNFFYLMDLNDEGHLRNVFWISSRSRAACGYFGDVVAVDTTCLSRNYETPLLAFIGVNHHGRPVLLGCGLVADETLETYVWLFRAWLTCMSGRPPQTIITDQCKALQIAIAEVFPRAHHRLCLSCVMQFVLENLQGESETLQTQFSRIVYDSIKADEFEIAWEDMIQRFGLSKHEWLQNVYEERERWAPAFLKDTFFAGMSTFLQDKELGPFFDGYVHKRTSLKEFFDVYELVLQKRHQTEASDDFQSRDSTAMSQTGCCYEAQLSKIYTREIFIRFRREVEMMSSCVGITQTHANGGIVTYMIKEREADESEIRNFEVIYDKVGSEVRCICSCFNFKGYLCRHALCILNCNGVEEIPLMYILSRWRKDFKRLYVPEFGPNIVDISNPVQWFDHLHRRGLRVVEEGMRSQEHYMVAWQAFKESLNKVRLGGLASV